MTTYTVTKESQERTHQTLSEAFGILHCDVKFEDYSFESNSPLIKLPGFPHTEETKRKISEKLTGKVVSPETRKRISDARTGMTFSPEHAAKCKENGIKSAELNRQRMSGRKVSDKTRKKVSETLRGRSLSEETKQKMSLSRKNPKRYECIHCHKMLPIANLKQFHGDKCNMKLEGFVV